MNTNTREKVIDLKLKGYSNPKISKLLNIGISTVRWHYDENFRNTNRQWKTKKRNDILYKLKSLKGNKCELCGYDKCQSALHFHHKNPAEKLFEISDKPLHKSHQILLDEIDKCQLLCANCHAEITWPDSHIT